MYRVRLGISHYVNYGIQEDNRNKAQLKDFQFKENIVSLQCVSLQYSIRK